MTRHAAVDISAIRSRARAHRIVNETMVGEDAMSFAYRIRNAFFCGTSYWSVGYELIFVHMPLIFAGAMCLFYSGKLSYLVFQMQRPKRTGSKDNPSAGKKKKTKGKSSKDKSLQALAMSMLRFAVVCIVCIFLYVITILLLLPEMRERAVEMARAIYS